MMQMLHEGGVEPATHRLRAADVDNPRGYYEFEPVKTIKRDTSWLPAMRGKAFKMVSQLLYHLPPEETYRVLFMERDLDEVLRSQEKMLRRLGRTPAPRDEMRAAYAVHLERLHEWLQRQTNFTVLRVPYGDLVQQPREQAGRVHQFLGGKADLDALVRVVDPFLYRNRRAAEESA